MYFSENMISSYLVYLPNYHVHLLVFLINERKIFVSFTSCLSLVGTVSFRSQPIKLQEAKHGSLVVRPGKD